jgi:hypothetical protein
MLPFHSKKLRYAWLVVPMAAALAAVWLLLGTARAARADMAPFPAQEGNSLGPAAPTHVQMVSETVLIQLANISNTRGDPSLSVLGAKVVADFAMRNPGTADEVLKVGFPMEVPKNAAAAGDYVKIANLAASAGGVAFDTQAETVNGEIWSAWQMRFAPGDTHVRITYDLPVTRDSCSAELGYVLHTGAAWAGPIGQADLIVRYPYAAEATFVSPKGMYLSDSTPGYQVEGTDLHWHYANLEPTLANDLAVTFVAPDCWLKVAQARVALNQQASAENYWHLAAAYAEIVFPHHGFYSPLIAQVADTQYQKALSLDPANPQLTIEYAEFLWYHVGYLLPADRTPDKIRQCAKALPLAPQDDFLAPTCGVFLVSLIGDTQVASDVQATVAAVLTVAPQPTLVPNATSTVMPSPTLSPSAQPTASPVPATTTSVPRPTASAATTQVAQVLATPLPAATTIPPAPAGAPNAWLPIGIAIVALVLIAGGMVLLRRPAG